MLAVLFLCGPIGTAVSFYLLPKESDSADTPGLIRGGAGAAGGSVGGTRVRMVHLSLAGTDRRARFVLDENTPWDAFVSGAWPTLYINTRRRGANEAPTTPRPRKRKHTHTARHAPYSS